MREDVKDLNAIFVMQFILNLLFLGNANYISINPLR